MFTLAGHVVQRYGRNNCSEEEIVYWLRSEYSRYDTARRPLADTWMELWALYAGTPDAMNHVQQRLFHTTGNPNHTYWRSKINSGKTYETVEKLVAYIIQALFPNDDWFDAIPMFADFPELVTPLKQFVRNKLHQGKFKPTSVEYIRQLLVTGTATMAVPWRYETIPHATKVTYPVPIVDTAFRGWKNVTEERVICNHPDFQVLNPFDVWFDPAVSDANEAGMFRRIPKRIADIMYAVKMGYYEPITVDELANAGEEYYNHEKQITRSFRGVYTGIEDEIRQVDVLEYWGDIHLDGLSIRNVWATIINNRLVRFQPNPYYDGRPFVTSTLLPILDIPYGMSVIEPNMGQLHELNVIVNSRLENIMLHVNSMFEVIDDGLLEDENITTEPGKTYKVREKGTINRIDLGNPSFVVTYQEQQQLNQTINENFGAGPALGTAPLRSGERVTAEEINAMRDAGGNRLSLLYFMIEETFLVPLLNRVFAYCQQFVRNPETVRVQRPDMHTYYYEIGPEQLQYKFQFRALGATWVVRKDKFIRNLQVLLTALPAMPGASEVLNFEALLEDMLRNLEFENAERYIKPPPQQAVAEPQDEMEDEENLMRSIGGGPTEQAVNNMLQTDPSNLLSMIGGTPNASPTPSQPPA